MRSQQLYDRAVSMLEDRERGMTYEEIGKKHGVSRQRVGQICGKWNKYCFKVIKKDGCVYVNLRDWMNTNSISRAELMRRMGYDPSGENLSNLRAVLRGNHNPRKEYIDKLIEATGLSYDELFEIG